MVKDLKWKTDAFQALFPYSKCLVKKVTFKYSVLWACSQLVPFSPCHSLN